jgi:molybdenum cofactor guanylyltransferase
MNKQIITGIVLAGGLSSRMSTDKSMLIWRGKTLIEHSIATLQALCSKVVISSGNKSYGFTGCEIWPDEFALQAPINGLYSCLKRSGTELNLVLSCDMPLINPELLEFLLESSAGYQVVVPVHGDGLTEPLCGVYRRSILPELEKYIQNGNLSLYRYIESCSHLYKAISRDLPFYSDRLFSNINTIDDFNQLLKD